MVSAKNQHSFHIARHFPQFISKKSPMNCSPTKLRNTKTMCISICKYVYIYTYYTYTNIHICIIYVEIYVYNPNRGIGWWCCFCLFGLLWWCPLYSTFRWSWPWKTLENPPFIARWNERLCNGNIIHDGILFSLIARADYHSGNSNSWNIGPCLSPPLVWEQATLLPVDRLSRIAMSTFPNSGTTSTYFDNHLVLQVP